MCWEVYGSSEINVMSSLLERGFEILTVWVPGFLDVYVIFIVFACRLIDFIVWCSILNRGGQTLELQVTN